MTGPALLLLWLLVALVSCSVSGFCDLFLAVSSIDGAGRGIFAGRDFSENELIEAGPTVVISDSLIADWPLENYVYGTSDEGRSMVVFGIGMLINHHSSAVVKNYWRDRDVTLGQTNEPQSTSTPSCFFSSGLRAGQEVFVSYSDDESWFVNREIEYSSNHSSAVESYRRPMEDLQEEGFCVSNVEVKPSTLQGAGMGLFTKVPVAKGQLVYISPVLFLSLPGLLATAQDSSLINYSFTAVGSEYAFLPLGLSAMMNHHKHANVRLAWLNVTPTDLEEWSLEELMGTDMAPLDVAYYATRDIQAGEELTIDYGEDWERSYLTYVVENQERFRHPVQVPLDMFPNSWITPTGTTGAATTAEEL